MRNSWVYIFAGIGAVIVIAVVVLFSLYGPDEYTEEGALAWGLEVGVADINRQAPIELDDLTTLTGAEIEGMHVTYKNALKQRLTPAEVDDFKRYQAPALVTAVCENADMQASLNGGASFTYTYVDESDAEVGNFTISKKDC